MIKSIEEISDIINEVSEKLDEPDLKNKKVEFAVSNSMQFDRHLKQLGITRDWDNICGTTTPKDRGTYLVTLRESDFHTLFTSYFHELGHVANYELLKLARMRPDKEAMFSDALAFGFEYYAKEKFNELKYPIRFIDVMVHHLRKQYLKKTIDKIMSAEDKLQSKPLMVLYVLLEANCKTYEEAYKKLKRLVGGIA